MPPPETIPVLVCDVCDGIALPTVPEDARDGAVRCIGNARAPHDAAPMRCVTYKKESPNV